MKKSILLATALAVGTFTGVHAQIVSGVSFLKGSWLQLAVSDCGTYTSGSDGAIVAAPGSYNENTIDGSLSFTNDVTQDGWNIGVPDQCGDFVMPGSPEEGFAIQIGGAGTVYANTQPWCYNYNMFVANAPGFPGNNVTNVNAGTTRKTLWQGVNTDLNLAVAQTTFWLASKQSYITVVDICNDGDDITNLFYARNADPDNDQLTTGDFTTANNAKKQYAAAGYAQVTAGSVSGSPCYMAYVSADPRAKVSHGNFAMGEPSDMWLGAAGYTQTAGIVAADQAIQISFKIDSLPNNACDCFTYSTMLTPDGLTNQLTLTTTACATIGTLARYGEEVLDDYLNDPDAFLNNEMMAFPNPSNGAFTVNLFEIEHANLVVTNTLGEIVYSANDVSKFVPVVLENAPTGLYFVNAYYGDGKVITKTIVVE